MNKFLLFAITCCALSFPSKAQVVFSEDFDGIAGPTAGGAGSYSFPSGWFLRNVDNSTPAGAVAYVNEAWERREDFSFNVADSCAFSTSWYSPVGAANDFMWTPLIGPLPANTVLTWNAVAYDAMYPDGYEVRVMTASSGPPTGGSGVIGNQLTSSTVVFSTAAEASVWTAHSVNLAAYTGQSIYIGFRNNSNDQFLLLIDDIAVTVQVNYDAMLTGIDTAQYTIEPTTQRTPDNIMGTVHNNGLNSLTNVQLKLNVYDGSMTQVYTSTSSPLAILAPNANATLLVGTYTPPAPPDIYTYEYVVIHSGAEQVPTNDTMYRTVLVDNSIYARDDGTVIGSLGIGAGNGYIGQQYEIVNNGKLDSIGIYFTRGYTGRRFACVVWNMVAGSPNTIIGGTDTLLYPDDSARYYMIPMHNGPFVLTPGIYTITAVEFDSTLAVGQTSSIFRTNTTWVNWVGNPFGTWANNEDFGASFTKTYVIRPDMKDICSGFAAMADSVNASCATCADGAVNVNTTNGVGPYSYLWNPGGMTLQNPTGLLPGTYTVIVTDAYGCTSIDSVSISFTTDIKAESMNGNISLMPNPASENFSLAYSFVTPTDMKITILNILGEDIFNMENKEQLTGKIEFSTSSFADGIYSVRIITDSGYKVLPLIVEHR